MDQARKPPSDSDKPAFDPSTDPASAQQPASRSAPDQSPLQPDPIPPSLQIRGLDFEWAPEQGTVTLSRLPCAIMWVDTTLAGLMSGVQAMVGTERFALALQAEGRRSVDADWQVISQFADFRRGFEAIADVAAVAGWGDWRILSFDPSGQELRVSVRNSWEGLYQKSLGVCWGSAMLAGKLAGYSSRLFGVNCWADQTAFVAQGDEIDEFVIRPSSRSVEREIERLLASDEATRADMAVALRKLETEVENRRRMEEALRESEQRFRASFEQAAVGMAHVSLDRRYLRVNQKFCEIVGYAREEVLELSIDDLSHPEDAAADHPHIRQILAGETEHFVLEKRYIRKDGEIVWIRLTSSLLRDPDGAPLHFAGVVEDISERKRLDAELSQHRDNLEKLVLQRTRELQRAREGAEAASRAKGEFLANMSHEIRTPLNAILGMAHLIRRGGTSPDQSERLDKLESAGEHLLEVINAILDLSKIEAGKLEMARVEVDLSRILQNVASFLSERLEAKGIELVLEAPNLDAVLLGDAPRLQQALLNYASNAVKFTEEGRVCLRAVVEAETETALEARFEVEDTGIGISPEDLSKLFSAFEQADNTDTRQYGGTGLGLAITKKLANLMGGDAGAMSSLGVGSTFWLTVTLEKGVGAEGPDRAESDLGSERLLAERYGRRRVLIVEDEPINREIAQYLVEDVGLIADLAEDGFQALELASSRGYDIILMDMQMPNMDGLEATLKIRALPSHASTPIIALTANAFEEHRTRCLDAGMNDFLTKPIDPDTLYSTLIKWIAAPGAYPRH